MFARNRYVGRRLTLAKSGVCRNRWSGELVWAVCINPSAQGSMSYHREGQVRITIKTRNLSTQPASAPPIPDWDSQYFSREEMIRLQRALSAYPISYPALRRLQAEGRHCVTAFQLFGSEATSTRVLRHRLMFGTKDRIASCSG